MARTGSYRAVVVDDSQFMRTVISDILERGDFEVVATARDGRDAVSTVAEVEPDLVTMDLEMPQMDGLAAVERIMETTPTPILMLSAHTDEDADVTFEALDRGAVDFFTKPGGEVSTGIQSLEEQLLEKATSVAMADVGTHQPTDTTGGSVVSPDSADFVRNPTVVIGASTGGPNVVEQILGAIPESLAARILIVQHMPDGFTGRFADRLDRTSDYDVREATDGERIGDGEALVAKGGKHLRVVGYHDGRLRVKLTEDAPQNGVRPAVDVTMETAAQTITDPTIGVILTGMGRDGAAGMQAIADTGGHTIVQDEETAAVFGMPKRAIETGCVESVLPVDQIASGIVDTLRTEVPSR
ncbi:MAG: chemotaxis response regulator protein-glutamate methylesterase [Halobacteriales archaeon]|nr:chemotaxis response regulator protein-glutamate methylesterase [Halobacteriales archaeon]